MTLEEVAQRVFWWMTSQEALADRHRFLAQVMTYGDVEDILTTKNHFTDDDFIEVLNRPPAGVFDPRSWSYWHAVYKLPLSPLPTRF